MITEIRRTDINAENKGYLEPLSYNQHCFNNNLTSIRKHPHIPKPPRAFLFFGRWFRFGVVIFLLFSVLLGTTGCTTNTTTTPWLVATKVVPVETVQAIVTENSALNPQEVAATTLAWAVNGQRGKLVIFNFNNSGICGNKGCLYVAYLIKNGASPVRVFSIYLNPNLPPNKLLFQVGNDPMKNFVLPCLQVQQPSEDNIRQLIFCFNGREYQLAKSSLIEVRGK